MAPHGALTNPVAHLSPDTHSPGDLGQVTRLLRPWASPSRAVLSQNQGGGGEDFLESARHPVKGGRIAGGALLGGVCGFNTHLCEEKAQSCSRVFGTSANPITALAARPSARG